MKFGIREVANIVFRPKADVKIGGTIFKKNQPCLYIDTATTSSFEQAASTVYATGGRGGARLLAWEGEKTLTVTFEDAMLSPIGLSILSGAGLFKSPNYRNSDNITRTKGNTQIEQAVHFHVNGIVQMKKEKDADGNLTGNGTVDLTEIMAEYTESTVGIHGDAPLYIMEIEDDGSVTGKILASIEQSADAAGWTYGDGIVDATTGIENYILTFPLNDLGKIAPDGNVMIDFYLDAPGNAVWEADITPNNFAGFYYVEMDTLVRQQSDGVDLPANITIPRAKLQSNFTITMAPNGDPSTFTFTLDCLPAYTFFDRTKKVLAAIQIAQVNEKNKMLNPVMPHNDTTDEYTASDGQTQSFI